MLPRVMRIIDLGHERKSNLPDMLGSVNMHAYVVLGVNMVDDKHSLVRLCGGIRINDWLYYYLNSYGSLGYLYI